MKRLLSDSAVPLYQQVCDMLRDEINTGVYRAGDRLPAEPELAAQFGVSRITLRTAVDRLVEEKLLLRRRGKGTYVAETFFTERVLSKGSFTVSCQRQGAVPSTHIISLEACPAGRGIAGRLGIGEEERIWKLTRLRLVDHSPAILEVDYFPYERFCFLQQTQLEDRSLFALLEEKLGVVPDSFSDEFAVRCADIDTSRELQCQTGTALLWIGQSVCALEQVVYYNEQFIRSERYRYAVKSVIQL